MFFLCFEIFQFELIGLMVEGIMESGSTSSVTTDKAEVAVVELTENAV